MEGANWASTELVREGTMKREQFCLGVKVRSLWLQLSEEHHRDSERKSGPDLISPTGPHELGCGCVTDWPCPRVLLAPSLNSSEK